MPLVALTAPVSEAQNTFRAERSISAAPLDLALSPDGSVAVVRGNSSSTTADPQRVTVWRTSDGIAIPVQGAQGFLGRGNLPRTVASPSNPSVNAFSDGVAASSNRAVAIGSADTDGTQGEDTTYIDVLAIDASLTNNATELLTSFVVPNSTDDKVRGGLAHDVAITPSGIYAVVNSRNWIHVIDLVSTDPPTLAAAFNIGSNAAGRCDPGEGCNSIALDDSHAVLTVQRRKEVQPSIFRNRTWVYVVDLTLPTPALVLEDILDPLPSGLEDQNPHDVAITPDGDMAMVTSSDAAGLIDLQAQPPSFLQKISQMGVYRGRQAVLLGPTGQKTREGAPNARKSIALTNQHCVLMGLEMMGGYVPTFFWRADVFTISQTPPNHLGWVATYRSKGSQGGPTTPLKPMDPYVDMVLSREGDRLAVKSLFYNVMVKDLTVPGTAFELESLRSWGNGAASNSVVIGRRYPVDVPVGSPPQWHQYAVFLGYRSVQWVINGQLQTRWESEVAFYDLDSSAPDLDYTGFTISDPAQTDFTLPADLCLAGGGYQVVARFSAPPDEPNPAAGGRDWYRFGMRPLGMVGGGIGGKGVCTGADSLEVKGLRSVSISENGSTPEADGYVHFVELQ